MFRKLFEKITGIDKIREETELALAETRKAKEEQLEAELAAAKAKAEAEEARKEEELAKLTPKERATAQGMPYVAVLDTHVNKDNIRNGFFELDWNDEFIVQLKNAGYGYDGDPDEEIVDRWFRLLCRDVAVEEGVDMTDRGAGYINVTKLADGKSEIS